MRRSGLAMAKQQLALPFLTRGLALYGACQLLGDIFEIDLEVMDQKVAGGALSASRCDGDIVPDLGQP